MCLVGDKVDGNLNLSGDGHCVGQLVLTRSKQVPYIKGCQHLKKIYNDRTYGSGWYSYNVCINNKTRKEEKPIHQD